HDAKVAVEILDLGLTRHGGRAIGSVQHARLHATGSLGLKVRKLSCANPQHSRSAPRIEPTPWRLLPDFRYAGLRKHYGPQILPRFELPWPRRRRGLLAAGACGLSAAVDEPSAAARTWPSENSISSRMPALTAAACRSGRPARSRTSAKPRASTPR